MRQSVAPHRASSASQVSSNAALSKLIEKKKEYDAVSSLERASALYLERIEALGEEFDIVANAGEGGLWIFIVQDMYQLRMVPVHGQVLAQWPKMFHILTEFCEHSKN